MKDIGLGHRTRELVGLYRTTTASGTMRGTGREATGVWNTITTGITVETATFTIMTGMVIVTMAGTRDSEKVRQTRMPRVGAIHDCPPLTWHSSENSTP